MTRTDTLQRAVGIVAMADSSTQWDVVIVGGGATGMGAAVDAASRGYRTLLLEQSDFGKGTSSRSTKLIHGGVRYLQQGNLSLVLEALRERGLLMKNAPHLSSELGFIVPSYSWWERPYYGVGLKLYNVLARNLSLGKSKILSREAAIDRLPTIRRDRLRGGVLYYDGQFDDARLVINLAQTAASLGAAVVNYARVDGLLKQEGRIRGVGATDMETGRQYEVSARVVLNATGVFADSVRRMDQPDSAPIIRPSQGIHIVLDRSFLPGDHGLMIPKTSDGRVLFALPWHDRVIVGTTDTPVDEIDLEPQARQGEVEYLLQHAREYLENGPTSDDVKSIFTGLRPLVSADAESSDTSSISRDHVLLTSASGLVTITSGKWTTYRLMAEDAIDRAAEVGALPSRECKTSDLPIHGSDGAGRRGGRLSVYGSDGEQVEKLIRRQDNGSDPLHSRLPYVRGEVQWAAEREMARTVEDVLARRTRALLLDARASIEAASVVAEVLAAHLGKDKDWEESQVEDFRKLASSYLPHASAREKGDATEKNRLTDA